MAGLLDDTTVSAIGYLNAIKAIVNEDADTALRYNAEAKAAFEQSKTHELWYLDHYEKAEVGVQHIVPFIKAMAKYVTDYIDTGINPNTQKRYTGTVTYEQISIQNNASEDKYFDGDNSSEVWLAKGPYENPGRDTIPAGATLTVTFPEPKTIGSFRLVQGVSAKSDKFSNADVEYQIEGTSTWTKAGTLSDKGDQTISFGNVANVKAVRIHNNTVTGDWVRIGEIEILSPANEDASGARAGLYTNVDTNITASLEEGSVSLSNGTVTLNKDEYIGVKLGDIKAIQNITIPALSENVVLETSMNEITWQPYAADAKNVDAAYIRIKNNGEEASQITLNDLK